jgi:hypothetical protein
MKFIDPKTIKRARDARKLVETMQDRMFKLENALDDIVRASELVRYTKDFGMFDVFANQSKELLEDRLVIEHADCSNLKVTVVETSEEAWETGKKILDEDPTIKRIKHGNIHGVVDHDGNVAETKGK